MRGKSNSEINGGAALGPLHGPPEPAPEQREARQALQHLRDQLTKAAWWKLLRRYGGMPGVYHGGRNPPRGRALLTDPVAMADLGHRPLEPTTLWELMAGTGGLSKKARDGRISHLPPIDHRWGPAEAEFLVSSRPSTG